MDTLRYLGISIFLCVASIHAQEPRILWEPATRLEWSDFQAKPPKSQRIAATTASGISYQYSATGTSQGYTLEFQVDTYFYPKKSWYHPEICDSVILSHEQLHFDIAELYAREFRRRLASRTFSSAVKAEVRALFKEINQELSEFQKRYDRETDFSRNREAQTRWRRQISERLRSIDLRGQE